MIIEIKYGLVIFLVYQPIVKIEKLNSMSRRLRKQEGQECPMSLTWDNDICIDKSGCKFSKKRWWKWVRGVSRSYQWYNIKQRKHWKNGMGECLCSNYWNQEKNEKNAWEAGWRREMQTMKQQKQPNKKRKKVLGSRRGWEV